MAAITEKSNQMLDNTATPFRAQDPRNWEAPIRLMYFNYTRSAQAAAGDAGSIIELVRIPPGQIRLILPNSVIFFKTFPSSNTKLSIGHRAYTDRNGTEISQSLTSVFTSLTVDAAGSQFLFDKEIGDDQTQAFDTVEGLTLFAAVKVGTLPASVELSGYFAYTQI